MFRIGQFSLLAKVSIKTLRYYDKIGLLKPAFIDSDTSYRYYLEEQLGDIRRILDYKEVGISNAEVLKILQDKSTEKNVLTEQKKTLYNQLEDTKVKIERLEGLISGNKQEYHAKVISVKQTKVYYCCGYVSNEQSIHDFIKACGVQFKKNNPDIKFSVPDYCCVIYHDEGYRESNMFIEYAQSVESFGKETETLKFKIIEPITAVSVVHYGEYRNLRDAYAYAVSWAKKNGYVINGNARERYVSGAWNCKDVSKWQTELQIPVVKEV